MNLALSKRDYHPRPPIGHRIAKASGGERIVSIFQIVDSVVSRKAYSSLMRKNTALMSARSYAYRSDLSTHDAIQYISSEFSSTKRLFVAEYDFSKYFDSIEHSHIFYTLKANGFFVTPAEHAVIHAFLSAPLQDELNYDPEAPPKDDHVGIPQGTSISLFLANVSAWQMDRSLERVGVGFARYADDTVIWAPEFEQITRAVNILKAQSDLMGARLNHKKSHGVRLFIAPGEPAEIASTQSVSFVGYTFQDGKVRLADAVVARMKKRIGYLIWANLLQAPQASSFAHSRVRPPIDRDYLVLLMQIRRYLYGNFSEARLRALERSAAKQIRFPGFLAYFPLVDDTEQLAALDGWLVSTIYQALRKRAALLRGLGYTTLPTPHGMARKDLISAMGETSLGVKVDLRLPSLARFMSVLRRATNAYGANTVSRGTGAEEYQYALAGIEL
ncbi:reverse transcriptase domain-containing protein [Clavibacter michiganensis]|uniref:reverse transcriptase domain-containing protein n=1 Tax=Clavibacter michiganensis TaxID=28447 RepID=UPI003EBB253B